MDINELRSLAEQKAKEWKAVEEMRVASLEEKLQQTEQDLLVHQKKFSTLKEDFKFNLKLLQERDKELEHYDKTIANLKLGYNKKSEETSELLIKMDELKKQMRKSEDNAVSLKEHYKDILFKQQTDLENYKIAKDVEIEKERESHEVFKRTLERRLHEMEIELGRQKYDLTTGFETILNSKDHEHRIKVDEFNNQVLALELKVKLTEKELELMQESESKKDEVINQYETDFEGLNKTFKMQQLENVDTSSIKDSKIKELQALVSSMENKIKRLQNEFQIRYAEMDGQLRTKEENQKSLQHSWIGKEDELNDKLTNLQAKNDALEFEIKRLGWNHDKSNKDRNSTIESLRQELDEMLQKVDRGKSEQARIVVNKDIEMEALKYEQDKLKADISLKKQDIDRYKKDLSVALDRQAELERTIGQNQNDWQKHVEDLERVQYSKNEDFIRNLTGTRDQALIDVKKHKLAMSHLEILIQTLSKDRDLALSTLSKHGLTVDRQISMKSGVSDDLISAQMQSMMDENDSLKYIISEMRNEIESLTQSKSTDTHEDNDGEPRQTEDENQMLDSKKKLNEKPEKGSLEGVGDENADSDKQNFTVTDLRNMSAVKEQLSALNEMIGSLRNENLDLKATLKKQEARLAFQDFNHQNQSDIPQHKQLEIDQLQHELKITRRRTETEATSLRRQISELGIQLEETRKESDEYYKESLRLNMEVTSLNRQISNLKINIAGKGSTHITTDQAKLIHNLQTENEKLQAELYRLQNNQYHPHRVQADNVIVSTVTGDNNMVILELNKRLKGAAIHIRQLANERQQLIEVSNNLRSKLTELSSGKDFNRTELEDLTYNLTKQQLSEEHKKYLAEKTVEQKLSRDTVTPRRSVSADNNGDSLRNPSLGIEANTSMTSSLKDTASIQELWRMLDDGNSSFTARDSYSPGVIADRHNRNVTKDVSSHHSTSLTVEGKSVPFIVSSHKDVSRDVPAAAYGKKYMKQNRPKSKIRNYNMKD